jgi:hypothetical protein
VRDGTRRALLLLGWSLAGATLLFHAWHAILSDYYVNATVVAGVWLGLADDLANGVLYRPLISDAGYGGTRYFPLFFSLIALLQRMGAPAVVAGYAASLLGAAVLGAGVYRLLAALGVRRGTAATGALLSLAPHFVQETVLAIRSDVLALGLVTWSFAFVARTLVRRDSSWWLAVATAVLLTLAFATKPAAAYGLVVAACVLFANGARREALRVAVLSVAGCLIVMAAMQVASHGHWLESFRACAFAGGSWLDAARLAGGKLASGLTASRLLTATVLLATFGTIATWRRARTSLPTIWLATAAMTTLLILSSPGTILTNHAIDLYVSSVVLLAAMTATMGENGRRTVHAALLALLIAGAWQNRARVEKLDLAGMARRARAERAELMDATENFGRPVFSETPQVPLLAGAAPVVLDPFALRVVAITHPEVLADIRQKLQSRHYSRVLLREDPETPRGRGWYTDAHFGWPIVEAMLDAYRYSATVAGMRVYTPKPE